MPAPFNLRDYQEAQQLLAHNPLLLRGRHLQQLQLFDQLPHAAAAVKYARQVEAAARRDQAQQQAMDERRARFARDQARAAAARDGFFRALDRSTF